MFCSDRISLTSCWLDSNRISLLAASCPDWFPHGLYVVKLHEDCVIHIRADGSVDTDSTLSSKNAWVLGARAPDSFCPAFCPFEALTQTRCKVVHVDFKSLLLLPHACALDLRI